MHELVRPTYLLGAVPFLCLAGVGYVILVRRHWMLAMALTCLLQATFFVTLGLTFYPRMFILALPLAILVAVQAISTAAEALARVLKRDASFARLMTTVGVLLLCVASVAALPRYYRTPKQPYRASLAHVEAARQPDGIVIEIHYAAGMKYYRERANVGSGAYFQARTVEVLDAVLAAHPNRPVWLLTTFPRALRKGVPDLDARIKRDWEIDRTFGGTIGDGDISVWRPRSR
jgi:mannosyltransferase